MPISAARERLGPKVTSPSWPRFSIARLLRIFRLSVTVRSYSTAFIWSTKFKIVQLCRYSCSELSLQLNSPFCTFSQYTAESRVESDVIGWTEKSEQKYERKAKLSVMLQPSRSFPQWWSLSTCWTYSCCKQVLDINLTGNLLIGQYDGVQPSEAYRPVGHYTRITNTLAVHEWAAA
jgi:hypothetical protein